MAHTVRTLREPRYRLDADGRFVIEQYNHAQLFTNFFPGIAGIWGIPMWVFYVNRGQCISSFGIESKDKSILEFQPANKAYRLTSSQGFRTFLKLTDKGRTVFYEPFQNNHLTAPFRTTQAMAITAHDLTLNEVNHTLGLEVCVNYFTLPEEPCAALVRRLTIRNTSKRTYNIELIDGLPTIIPFGMNDWLLKNMSRTLEAWVRVENLNRTAPYFNVSVVVNDSPQVEHITAGNFYCCFSTRGRTRKLCDTVVEPMCVFGNSYDFAVPETFMASTHFQVPSVQKTKNKMPCAMGFERFQLPHGRQHEVTSLIGHIHSQAELNTLVRRVTSNNFIERKAQQNAAIIDGIKNYMLTASSSDAFDLYCGQTFLDNVLRGGLPVPFKTYKGTAILDVYSRKHGDPERDYNHFYIAPTYLSEGNGNYRDVNQNRRNNIWFNTDVADTSLLTFLNLIQADGYNPLVVKGATFFADDAKHIRAVLRMHVASQYVSYVEGLLHGGFDVGQFLIALERHNVKFKTSAKQCIQALLPHCRKHDEATHGDGYWIDHWAYNVDLLERYFALYPENRRALLLGRDKFTFYHSAFYVAPRDERYVLTTHGCRQYHSVVDGRKHIKVEKDHKLRIHNGRGPVYHTNLAAKLLSIAANKAASFDPSGIGIEMEADKPNWYDALNGLPGLLGSSLCETIELKRLCVFLLDACKRALVAEPEFKIFKELAYFIEDLAKVMAYEHDPLAFWMRANEAKELYRSRIREGIDGQEKDMEATAIFEFLHLIIARTDKAIKRATAKDGTILSYFWHEVTEYEKLDTESPSGLPHIWPLKFKRHDLPLFLEGFVHALRIEQDVSQARKIYQSVRKSPLFDRALGMYRVNADLSKESQEIGRARVFPPGWLENQSIWLHMEFKFLVELLRTGLYKEFYDNFCPVLIPFLDPKIYGRSILENSSFIVSSAHEDSRLHGRGFVARLSGTTAEILHMWLLMNLGPQPFSVDEDGRLTLTLSPIIAGWLFTKKQKTVMMLDADEKWHSVVIPKNAYAFKFLNSTLVVYHNPKRKDTFGPAGARVERIAIQYQKQKRPARITGQIIPHKHARDIRAKKAKRIDVYLA